MTNIKALAFTVQSLLESLMFQTELQLQNYGMTDRTKTICPPPPIFDLGGTEITMPGLYKNHSRCSEFSKLIKADRQIYD